ncbi:MAG: hypothetical protein C0518_10165 [Opitutus sp.]|nr:hypothetical protein [Opitutus sp.]
MPIRILSVFSLLVILPVATRAAVYIEPRLSLAEFSGTPSIGDFGVPLESASPRLGGSLAVGTHLTSRVRIELRFTTMGEISVLKESPNWHVIPGEVILPAVRPYEFRQQTQLLSLALPLQLLAHRGWTLCLVPILQAERSRVELIDQLFPLPAGYQPLILRRDELIHRETREEVAASAEIELGYQLNERVIAIVHYTYAPLATVNAHLFGAGVGVKF